MRAAESIDLIEYKEENFAYKYHPPIFDEEHRQIFPTTEDIIRHIYRFFWVNPTKTLDPWDFADHSKSLDGNRIEHVCMTLRTESILNNGSGLGFKLKPKYQKYVKENKHD